MQDLQKIHDALSKINVRGFSRSIAAGGLKIDSKAEEAGYWTNGIIMLLGNEVTDKLNQSAKDKGYQLITKQHLQNIVRRHTGNIKKAIKVLGIYVGGEYELNAALVEKHDGQIGLLDITFLYFIMKKYTKDIQVLDAQSFIYVVKDSQGNVIALIPEINLSTDTIKEIQKIVNENNGIYIEDKYLK